MIFITVGSQKFQFDRLLRAVDSLNFDEEVFAQVGYSNYKPIHYAYKAFLNRNEYAEAIEKSDIVITHGGTGAIIGAVKMGKKVIAVPRLAKFGEHVDDHQIQLIEQFEGQNLICGLQDCEHLKEAVQFARHHQFNIYKSNTKSIIDSIERFINCIPK